MRGPEFGTGQGNSWFYKRRDQKTKTRDGIGCQIRSSSQDHIIPQPCNLFFKHHLPQQLNCILMWIDWHWTQTIWEFYLDLENKMSNWNILSNEYCHWWCHLLVSCQYVIMRERLSINTFFSSNDTQLDALILLASAYKKNRLVWCRARPWPHLKINNY
jgi:hypothetical protein